MCYAIGSKFCIRSTASHTVIGAAPISSLRRCSKLVSNQNLAAYGLPRNVQIVPSLTRKRQPTKLFWKTDDPKANGLLAVRRNLVFLRSQGEWQPGSMRNTRKTVGIESRHINIILRPIAVYALRHHKRCVQRCRRRRWLPRERRTISLQVLPPKNKE